MQRRASLSITTLLLAVLGSTAAGHGERPGYPNSDHPGYGRVLEVSPRYATIQTAVPTQECWNGHDPYRSDGEGRGLAGAVVGAVVGGLIGHRIAQGDGRVAATIVGTAIGALAGYRIGDHLADDADQGPPGGRRCGTLRRTGAREELVGYRVKYLYRGRIHQTDTDYHPGDRIRVDLGLRPMHF